MNSRIVGVEDADVLLLVGTNPRVESPVLNARILKATRKNNLKVFLIGVPNELTYNYVHLGNNASVLADVAAGTHPLSERLKKAQLPMVIVGSSAVERRDGDAVLQYVKQITHNTGMVKEGWNGFNILHRDVGRINALEVGITS
jgi:NADH dehydrogenase/NADH:ubiquinone oxidoreductase subunit G